MRCRGLMLFLLGQERLFGLAGQLFLVTSRRPRSSISAMRWRSVPGCASTTQAVAVTTVSSLWSCWGTFPLAGFANVSAGSHWTGRVCPSANASWRGATLEANGGVAWAEPRKCPCLRRCSSGGRFGLPKATATAKPHHHMSTGRNNKLAGQVGEFLVCAELGRRGFIATPFSGNVPAFDVLAADDQCNTVPIQVKASRGDNWPSDARKWMKLTLDPQTKAQINDGPQEVENPALIYVHVAIATSNEGKDQFFILTKRQLQKVAIKRYSTWMDTIGWKRPRNPESYDCRYSIQDLEQYRDNWKLITEQLLPSDPANTKDE